MALLKDSSIQFILEYLGNRFGKDSINIQDYWDGDLCAIGLKSYNSNFLIYISTFDKPEERYFVQIEQIPDGNDLGTIIKSYDCLTKEELGQFFLEYII